MRRRRVEKQARLLRRRRVPVFDVRAARCVGACDVVGANETVGAAVVVVGARDGSNVAQSFSYQATVLSPPDLGAGSIAARRDDVEFRTVADAESTSMSESLSKSAA